MTNLKTKEKGDGKIPFSHVVKQAVDELQIRDYYKGVDDLKLAKHVKELMQILFLNHQTTTQQGTPENKENQQTNTTSLVVHAANNFLPQEISTQQGINEFYRQIPKILRNSPRLSPHDKILCQTVLDLLIDLNFNVENDVDAKADPVTEMLTTSRIPDRKELTHYISKKEEGKNMSRVGRNGSGNIEQLWEHDVAQVPGDLGIDLSFKKRNLYRIISNGINKLSHTPFEYFHHYDEIKTNRGTIYLVRVYTHKDPSTSKDASIFALLDAQYNFINPTFPVIDDSESNQLIMTNFFGTYNIGYFAGGVFFRYKGQLILIKNGKYALPGFADQVVDKKFHTLKITTGGFALSYEDNPHYKYTDNYFRVLGKDMDEVKKLTAKKK